MTNWSLMIHGGDFGVFVTRPISATLLAVTLLVWLLPVFTELWKQRRKAAA